METPSDNAREVWECSVEPTTGPDGAADGGEAGSVMEPLLPRVPPLPYGLLRGSATAPAGSRPLAASGDSGCSGREAGMAEASFTAGGVARATSAFLSEPAVGGPPTVVGSPPEGGKPSAGSITGVGWSSANAPAALPIKLAPTMSDASRRPITEPV